MSSCVFMTNGISIDVQRPRAVPYVQTVRMLQPHDISRGGVFYLYDRGGKAVDHRLLFTRVAPATVAALLDFADAVKAAGLPCSWIDPLLGEHKVWITSRVSVREPLPDLLTVALTVTEYRTPYDIMVNSLGDELLMADGSELIQKQ